VAAQESTVIHSQECRFDGRVIVITGAGNGLGRAHAELIASRGGSVVVNDAEVAVDGTPIHGHSADAVAEGIRARGGHAIADGNDVSDPDGGARLIDAALAWGGRLDGIIHSAGILRNAGIEDMSGPTLSDVLDVHLYGAFHVIRPAWPHLISQRFGRIVLTSSAAGIFGAVGSSNYAAAKMGLVGLALSLAEEGRNHGVLANVIVPMARTRMSVDSLNVLPPLMRDRLDQLDPASVATVVGWLAHEDCAVTGEIFAASGGHVQRIVTAITSGIDEQSPSIESVRQQFDAIRDLSTLEPADNPVKALQLRIFGSGVSTKAINP
jgi:NAD(P)-dependent dehydrogenase (short-subunit alcohol dehydrogenase family)